MDRRARAHLMPGRPSASRPPTGCRRTSARRDQHGRDGGIRVVVRRRCGTYTIRRGDTKGAVAADHDVTVAELDAANADTQFYSGFVIGIEIAIPC